MKHRRLLSAMTGNMPRLAAGAARIANNLPVGQWMAQTGVNTPATAVYDPDIIDGGIDGDPQQLTAQHVCHGAVPLRAGWLGQQSA